MDFKELLVDKTLKPKEKTELLSKWVTENPAQADTLIEFAKTAKDPVKATCIEALEYASKTDPELAAPSWLEFVSHTLAEKAPRIKWESAKVIGNIAHRFPKGLETAVRNLLDNAEHEGTVVRWSTAFALGQIIQITPPVHKGLRETVEAISRREEKNSITKIYAQALKKSKPE